MPRTLQIESINSNSNLTFSTSSTEATIERLRIDTSGNVGIGTTSNTANSKLEVYGNSAAAHVGIRVNNAAANGYGTLWISNNGSNDGLIRGGASAASYADQLAIITSGATPVIIATNNTERLRIDSSGNVGVGTASPSGRLTTIGSSAASAVNIDFGNAAAQAVGDAVTLRLLPSTAFVSAPTSAPYISAIQTNASTSATDIAFGTFNGSALGERLRIDSSGNVGIGTASPTAKLSVVNSSSVQLQATTGTVDFRIQSIDANSAAYSGTVSNHAYAFTTNNAERLRIDSSGNVGIGMTNGTSKLNIYGATGAASATWAGGSDVLLLNNNGSYSEQAIAFQESSINIGAKIGVKNTANGAYDIIFANRANTSTTSSITEKMRIDSSGNVGIGTASPTKTLDVNGTANITGNLTLSGQSYFVATTITNSGASYSWNLNTNQVSILTLNGNKTLDNPTNQNAGAVYILIVKQSASGSNTLAFGTSYKFPGGIVPTISTTANKVDVLTFVSDGTNMLGVASQSYL